MKTVSYLFRSVALLAIVFGTFNASIAAEKKESIKVWGNCGMCKKTIEKSLKGAEGVQSATWDKKTKMLNVSYDDAKTSLQQIEAKIGAAGYDTQSVKADDKAYSKLPDCCQYERKKS